MAELTGDDRRAMAAALLTWFDAHGRPLAFRDALDPWHVLVSEVMLQQTQVARVEAAWTRFTALFPTPGALAAASVADALRAWAGLGYNRRAVALHRAASVMVAEHGGTVPEDLVALEALPGVGPYTARAVAAIAFGRPVAAIDTNLRRVFGRVLAGHGWSGDAGTALAPTLLQATLDGMVDSARSADWTHAAMDVGATLCSPTTPACPACPLQRWCRFAAAIQPEVRAARRASGSGPTFTSTARWLRGRIIDRLRAAPDGDWIRLVGPMGDHSVERVSAAVRDLEREGMLETRPDGRVRLPSTP